jgi:creatinine amidohydrolase
VFIGDSGGNQGGQQAVAERLTADWNGRPLVLHVPEYYDYAGVDRHLVEQGVLPEERPSDGLHDDPVISMNMLVTDPESIRHAARVATGLATINGVSLADLDKALEIGRMIVAYRARVTAAAIRAATANRER